MKAAGLPHSETPGSKPVDGSPGLVAVFRVLRSLLMPRHPSCARIRLARNFIFSLNLGVPPFASRLKEDVSPFALRATEDVYVAILYNLQLPVFKEQISRMLVGGGSRIRTGDILLAKQTLYQLSYTPGTSEWWA